jgi:FkbM family methyltransferase
MSKFTYFKKILGISLLRRTAIKGISRVLSLFQTSSADDADLRFCYRLLLDRKPDKEGLKHWRYEIRKGKSKENLVETFLASQELINKEMSRSRARVETGDFSIFVDSRDLSIGDYIMRNRKYEPHVTAVLKRTLKPGQTFLDIGANIGWHTLTAASLLKENGKIIAVEPNPRNVQLLYHSITINGFRNVRVFPFAASDENRLLQLIAGISNGVVKDVPQDQAYCEYVPAFKIDDLVKDEPRIDVIKIDIDGHEPKALLGMSATIRKHRPIIISEFSPSSLIELSAIRPEDYLRSLQQSGYALSIIEDDGSEMPANDEAKVMHYWDEFRKTHDESFVNIDIVARPK